MRSVTVYGLTAHQAFAGDFVEMHRMSPGDRVFPVGPRDAVLVPQETVNRIQMKVHTIRKARRVPGVRSADTWGDFESTETYIAIEPELEQLLMLPIKARIEEVHAEAARRAGEVAMLRKRIAEFKALPWYRRVWLALRRTGP